MITLKNSQRYRWFLSPGEQRSHNRGSAHHPGILHSHRICWDKDIKETTVKTCEYSRHLSQPAGDHSKHKKRK